ncbi:hypothetical protein MRX96_021954 [Rhipicephalus microplus]
MDREQGDVRMVAELQPKVCGIQLFMSVAVIAAVGAALKVYEDDDVTAVWGTRIMLSKNERITALVFVTFLLLYTADFMSAMKCQPQTSRHVTNEGDIMEHF